MRFCFEIFEWENESKSSQNHIISHCFIWSSPTGSSLHKTDEIRNIVGHLRCRRRSTIFEVNHSIIKLSWHSYNHVIKVRIEVLSFRNISSIRSFIMVACGNIINIIDSAWSVSDLRKISWPNSSIYLFGLILRIIWRIYPIADISISFIPLLIIILLKMMVSWVNSKVFSNESCQFELFKRFI